MAQRIIKQKAIFLDRDGTLIRQCADIVRPSQLRILKNAPEGLRLMRELGYRLLVISNQPVIGKGFIDHKGVTELHDVLNMKLAKRGGHVDAFYVCPHRHWDTCSCRKPKLGLVRRGIQRFRISARDSFFIGDSFRDVQTGKNA